MNEEIEQPLTEETVQPTSDRTKWFVRGTLALMCATGAVMIDLNSGNSNVNFLATLAELELAGIFALGVSFWSDIPNNVFSS